MAEPVGDVDRIKRVARRVKKAAIAVTLWWWWFRLSCVTNSLIDRAKAIQKNPVDRELDVLMTCGEQETIALMCMALDALGVPAISELVGRQEPKVFTQKLASRK